MFRVPPHKVHPSPCSNSTKTKFSFVLSEKMSSWIDPIYAILSAVKKTSSLWTVPHWQMSQCWTYQTQTTLPQMFKRSASYQHFWLLCESLPNHELAVLGTDHKHLQVFIWPGIWKQMEFTISFRKLHHGEKQLTTFSYSDQTLLYSLCSQNF